MKEKMKRIDEAIEIIDSNCILFGEKTKTALASLKFAKWVMEQKAMFGKAGFKMSSVSMSVSELQDKLKEFMEE